MYFFIPYLCHLLCSQNMPWTSRPLWVPLWIEPNGYHNGCSNHKRCGDSTQANKTINWSQRRPNFVNVDTILLWKLDVFKVLKERMDLHNIMNLSIMVPNIWDCHYLLRGMKTDVPKFKALEKRPTGLWKDWKCWMVGSGLVDWLPILPTHSYDYMDWQCTIRCIWVHAGWILDWACPLILVNMTPQHKTHSVLDQQWFNVWSQRLCKCGTHEIAVCRIHWPVPQKHNKGSFTPVHTLQVLGYKTILVTTRYEICFCWEVKKMHTANIMWVVEIPCCWWSSPSRQTWVTRHMKP